jgi:hypothetical protein
MREQVVYVVLLKALMGRKTGKDMFKQLNAF